MNTATNIAAMQITGGGSITQSPQSAASSPDLLGFLNAFFQQMQLPAPDGGAAQTAPPGLEGLSEKIAALLKNEGISADQVQNMPPQDLAAQITKVLQQQDVNIPAVLQDIPADDLSVKLASLIQKNSSGDAPFIKPSLTRDLVAPHSANIHDTETKEDIAKKIADMLEQQQQSGAVALSPVQFHQLEADFAQLQTASGTISVSTMDQLKTDLKAFLSSQGVPPEHIASLMSDLTKTLQPSVNNQPQAASLDTDTDPAAPHITAQPHTETAEDLTARNLASLADKTRVFGGKDKLPLGTNESTHASPNISQQQPAPAQPSAGVTAKVSGMSVNPALIHDLASGGNSDGGFGGDFGQGGNFQQAQDLTGSAAFLQPLTADMLQNQNFINYMHSASSSQPSPTTQLVNIQLQNNINAGLHTMTLQLGPAELGRMNVRLHFSKDGTVKAHMTVDKPETLALLQKDASHLQRALQQTGLMTDENSLSFDLRQQGQHQHAHDFNGHGGGSGEYDNPMDTGVSSALQAQLAIQSSGYITPGGVNIMV